MKAYELLFFVNPSLDDEARAGVMKRIDSTIVENGGAVESVEDWGKRKLAYTIDKLTEGDYTLINFQLDPACIAELDRVLGILDGVVCKIGLSLLFVNVMGMGYVGYFMGIAFSRILPGILCFAYYLSGKWKTRKLLSD